jgi:hypothetical protein
VTRQSPLRSLTTDELHEDVALERQALQDLDEIDYARLGWYTQPTSGKIPLLDSVGRALPPTRDEAQIRRRHERYPEAGVSLALWESRLISLDEDAHRGGKETFAQVLSAGSLPPSPICSTPRGGRHLLFRQAVCTVIAGKTDGLGPGLDVLTNRCVVPPTPGYFWIVSPLDAGVAYLPYWLWKLLPKFAEAPRQRSGTGRRFRFKLDEVLPHLRRLRGSRAGGWSASCPAHDDSTPSFSITIGDDGSPVFYCFAGCSFEEIVAALERLAGIA